MLSAYLVVNKPSTAAEYLEKHNIMHIEHYATSLSSKDMSDSIIDVDKLLYIYYGDVPDDTTFKADLSVLRNRLESAYFTCRSFLFILVKARPDLPDYIHAALDRFHYDEDKLEIIIHNKELMLPELSNYISGVTIGDTTKNSFIDVYITEAGKEDKERYYNIATENLDMITPSLVDEAAMYKSRIVSLAPNFDINVSQVEKEKDFSIDSMPYSRKAVQFMETTILVSGDTYTSYEFASLLFARHFTDIGERVFIVDLTDVGILSILGEDLNIVTLPQLWHRYVPEKLLTYIHIKPNEYASILSNESNIDSTKYKIVVLPSAYFEQIHKVEIYSLATLYSVYVLHKTHISFDMCTKFKDKLTALVVDSSVFDENFNIGAYKEVYKNVSCVLLPQDTEYKHNFYYDCFDRGEVE